MIARLQQQGNSIGLIREGSLHAALKAWYAQPGDLLEADVEGFRVDIVRGDLLIEIQTCNFAALRRKLTILTENHRMRVVYPIAQEKRLVRASADGRTELARRRSPKRGRPEHVFAELVHIAQWLTCPNLSLEVLLIQAEEIQRNDGQGSWRRKGCSIQDRRLVKVLRSIELASPADLYAFIPPDLPEPFTSEDLASRLGQPRRVAQAMLYCLRQARVLRIAGKRGKGLLYVASDFGSENS